VYNRQKIDKDKQSNASRQMRPPAYQVAEFQRSTIHPCVLQRAIKDPHAARPETILQLQRLYGNKTMSRMLAAADRRAAFTVDIPVGVQPKLTVGPVGDVYEREADRVAAQVVGQIDAPQARQSAQSQAGLATLKWTKRK
jgi:hypothetical protein